MGLASFASAIEPASISGPAHFGVKHYQNDYFVFTISIPDDLRAIAESSASKIPLKIQIDYKMGNGEWHHTSEWDTAQFGMSNAMGVNYIKDETYISQDRASLSNMFKADATALQGVKNSGWDFPAERLSFRVRFVATLDGYKTYTYSDWSETFIYAKDVVSNPDELIKYAPTLTTATVEKNTAGMPFLRVMTDRIPGPVQDLNAMTGTGVNMEVWMRRAGEKDFKLIHSSYLYEFILIGVDDYFDKTKQNYEEEGYEIKIRYVLNDLRKYPQAGRSDIIYSPFSNIYSQNMPAWSGASKWATTELTEADQLGLIPEILKGADMTKPITREEFAELAVLLYEKTTGLASTPMEPNPFIDTVNPQVLKAANLGITKGTSPTEFSPDVLINREQCATMLFRALKAMKPEGDYSIEGVKDFADQLDISGFAVEATKYMSKIGIILGDVQGRFMPKATTTAQKASGYGMATREQAIAMSLRSYKK